MKSRICAGLLVLILASPLFAEEKFLLQGGETIVFFGDSITQNGGYVNYFEAYLLTRFPDKTFRVINHGISSETISGTSEEDHQPRRPWALPRFTRDIVQWKPDVVVACFGMNDGNYHPFDDDRFKKYQQGIRTLIKRTKEETNAKLILMTPPPYDPYRRRVSDADATSFGYKFAAVDYDQTLAAYSKWLVSLRQQGQRVVDLHSAINAHLNKRREKQVSFFLSLDAVHPNPTGHWLMAHHLLSEMNAPRIVADISINAQTLKAKGDGISQIKMNNDGISFQWESPLPMPVDPAWDKTSIELEKTKERFNHYRLRITGLREKKYRMSVNGLLMGELTSEELRGGIDLLRFSEFPTVKKSSEILKLIKQRRALVYRNWRNEIKKPSGRKRSDANRIEKNNKPAKEIDGRIHKLRQPLSLQIRVKPVTNQ